MSTTQPITVSVPLASLAAARDRYASAARTSVRDLIRVLTEMVENTETPSAGILMEVHLLAGMVEAQWAQTRSMDRLIQAEEDLNHASDT